MLFPIDVIPFLQDERQYVREHALYYLTDARDPAPATADDLWRMIDRFGVGDSIGALARLSDLPQTETSFRRTMQALTAGNPEELLAYHLQHAIQDLDLEFVRAHQDELLECQQLLPHLRAHLRQRLELIDQPPEQLWEQLMRHGKEVGDAYAGEFDVRISERLIEAIGRRPGADVPRWAVDVLDEDDPNDWREIFAVQVIGAARYEPAVERLIQKLLIDADILRERANDALVEIGTMDVIQRLEAFYPGKEWDVRLYASGPLDHLKRPESEAALLRLLDYEPADDLAAGLAESLCMLCPGPEHLAMLRDRVAIGGLERQGHDVPRMIMAAGAMVGYEPPEARRWLSDIHRQTQRQSALSSDDEGFWKALRDRWWKGEFAPQHPEQERGGGAAIAEDEWDAPVMPIRRAAPKVGRNEPCPCGSGKKYKKCCGA